MKNYSAKLCLTVLMLFLFCSVQRIASAYELSEVDWIQTERILYDSFSKDSATDYEYGNSSPTYNADTQNLTITMGTAGNFYLELPEISPEKRFVVLTYHAQVSASGQIKIRPMLYHNTTKYAIAEDSTMALSKAGTYYEVGVVFDRKSGSTDIFIDRVKVQSGKGTFPEKNWSLRLLAQCTSTKEIARTMTIDEIAVYESDTCFLTEKSLGEPYLTVEGQATKGFTTGSYQLHVDVPAQDETQNFVIIAAEYQHKRLLGIGFKYYEVFPEDGNTQLVLDVSVSNKNSDTLTCMVWNDLIAMSPLLEKEFQRIDPEKLMIECMYPNFTFKAVTFSFDDGNVSENCDKKLITMMNQYGVKGTFNLYPYRWRDCTDTVLKERIQLYDGHEVANHSYSHFKTLPYLDQNNVIQAGEVVDSDHEWTEEEALKQIQFGNVVLKDWFGYEMRGFVYPGGYPEQYRPSMKTYMKNNGIVYARPVAVSKNFELPTDWLGWKNTCKSENMGEYIDSYFSLNPGELKVFSVWGHSQDLNTYETWDVFEDLCLKIQQNTDTIWNPTNIELYDYIKATEELEITDSAVTNRSDRTVYLRINNQKVSLLPNESYSK